MTGVVLGIDPGSVVTGYGAVRSEGNRLIYVDCGVIRTPSKQPFVKRIETIYDGLCEVIERVQPGVVAVESVFHAKHAASALKLGQARGVALLAGVKAGLEIHEYPPAKVKNALTGSGRADKQQVKMMVETLLGRKLDVPEDGTDAMAVAICHVHASPFQEMVATGGRRVR